MAIKVKRTEKLYQAGVGFTKAGPKVMSLTAVSKLPTKLGIDQVAKSAEIGIRIGGDGSLDIVGLDSIIRRSPLAASGRCTL